MGCFNECCWDPNGNGGAGISVCEHVLGGQFVDEFTIDNESCFVWLFDDSDNAGQTNCFGCDVGCKPCVDSKDNMITSWEIDEDGYGYLRANLAAARNRDAQNRIADFATVRPGRKPGLFTRTVSLQRSRCKSNHEDYSCWGEVGHPCQCFHEPSQECEDHSLFENSPLPGFMKDKFFYEDKGWPRRSGTGLTCSGWKHGTFEDHWDPEYDIEVHDSSLGLPQLMWAYTYTSGADPICNIDTIVGCAGRVAAGTDCQTTEGDCGSGLRDGEGPTQNFYCGSGANVDCGQFEYMRFTSFAPRFHGESDDIQLRNQILAEIPNILDTNGLFDAVQHRVGAIGNVGLRRYERTWERSLEEGHVVTTIQANTKWGNCPVTAEIVITKVDFKARAMALRTKQEYIGQGTTTDHHITPFVVCHLDVEIGIRTTLNGSCEVNGEAVNISYPGGSRMPVVSPAGNEIIYPMVISPAIDWHGRLDFHSSPQTQPRDIVNDPETGSGGAHDCRDQRFSLGTISVPGLPADITNPNPNTHYDGAIEFVFGRDTN